MRSTKLKTLFLLLLLITSVGLFAQTKNEAIDAYNEGAALMVTNPAGAITAFEKCVAISEQLGEEGAETLNNASKQIPGLHYKIAMTAYKKKDFPAAIVEFEKAKETAKKYDNPEIAAKANKVIPQVYNISGTNHYKNKRYEDAIMCFDKSIEYDPGFAKPHYGQAVVYKKQGNTGKMLAACDKAIEIGEQSNDKKTVSSAKKLIKTTMYNEAVTAIGKEQWTDAEAALNKSAEYGNDTPDVNYQLGKVYNAQKKWDEAAASLNKAIEMDEGDSIAKAKYYYELGNTHIGAGDNAAACAAFKNAMYGDYAVNAKYQVEQVLKCN